MTNTPSNNDLALATELHRQAASGFLCWPMDVLDLCQNDKDLPKAIEKLAEFIARWEQKGRESATPPAGGPVAWRHKFQEWQEWSYSRKDPHDAEQIVEPLYATHQPQEPACRDALELADGLAAVLTNIKLLKPEPIGNTGFQTGSAALLGSDQRLASENLKGYRRRRAALSSPANRTASPGGDVEIIRLRDSIAAIQKATVEGRVCGDVAWFDGITTLHDFCDLVLNGPDPDVQAQEPPANSIEQDGGIRDALAPFAKFGLGATVAAQTTGTLAANTTAGVGVKEALESAADWCETEGYKIGAVDGYDYRSGEEYGLRCAQIELRKRAKALASLPASGRGA